MADASNALNLSAETVRRLRALGYEVPCQHGYNTCCGVYPMTHGFLLEVLSKERLKQQSLEAQLELAKAMHDVAVKERDLARYRAERGAF